MVLILATVLMATIAAAPVDVKGTWEGKLTALREDGTTHEDTALVILEQKDSTITGTVGGNENDRHPITSGSIDGDRVTLMATTGNGRELKIELTVENDEMKGTITSGERKAQLQLKKRKE
jgi:hypothetical protein